MSSFTSAGTQFALSASAPATYDSSGYGALPYTTVGEIDDITGDIGRVYNLVSRTPLAKRGPVKKKGGYNDGNFTLALALDYDDTGQDLARTALGSDSAYSFKMTLQTGDVIYGQILVMGFTVNIGNTESFTNGTITCEIVTSDTGVGIVVVEA